MKKGFVTATLHLRPRPEPNPIYKVSFFVDPVMALVDCGAPSLIVAKNYYIFTGNCVYIPTIRIFAAISRKPGLGGSGSANVVFYTAGLRKEAFVV